MTQPDVPDRTIRTWPTEVYPYRSGAVGGVLGGMAMGLIAAVVATARGDTPWLPVNLIAATLLRDLQSAPLEVLNQFHLGWALLGVGLHLLTSIVVGLTFVLVLPTLPGPAWAWSLVLGTLLWVGALYAILPLVNPVMFEFTDKPSFILANVVYAVVLGLTITRYHKIANPPL